MCTRKFQRRIQDFNIYMQILMWIFHADFLKASPMELGADLHQIHIQSASNYFDVDFQLPIDFKDKFQSGICIKERHLTFFFLQLGFQIQ